VNLSTARAEVDAFFRTYGANASPTLLRSGTGKVYELYCLARTVEYLASFPGVSIRFNGRTVDFKASPGLVDHSKSYFVVSGHGADLELHVDIEVRTLSSSGQTTVADRSSYHEIDLVLLDGVRNRERPAHDQIVLGVECKAQATFGKETVRQVLGVRRELSLLRYAPSKLDAFLSAQHRDISADPPSQYWLAFTDPRGMEYQAGPAMFEVQFKEWCPP